MSGEHNRLTHYKTQKRSLFAEFGLAASATSCACLFTNPMEVVKTRMQLQGELAAGSRPYRNVFHAFWTIGAQEGLRGLQRGLGAGILYQCAMNGSRLGFYGPLKQLMLGDEVRPGTWGFSLRNVCAGATSGAIGALIGSPFFLVKCRIQAYSPVVHAQVGVQHAYSGLVDAFRSIVRAEGARGLLRGVEGGIPRVMAGSASQLASYDACKAFVVGTLGIPDDVYGHIAASLVAGLVVTTVMNPFDVVSTRLYNQDGKLYTGPIDCAIKTWRAEGLRGFAKGWSAHYLRLGPHTVLTFVFWEQTKRMYWQWQRG